MPGTELKYGDAPGVSPTRHETTATVRLTIPLMYLVEPLNPMRHNMDDEAMRELMDSIRDNGLLQNLCVVPIVGEKERVTIDASEVSCERHLSAGGRFRVCCGHRRLLACRGISLQAADCKAYCDAAISEETIMAQENGIREEPSDFDLAVMYAAWIAEPNMTEAALKKRAGKSLDFIYGRAEIMQGWKEVADALHERKIPFSVARELNRVKQEGYMLHFLSMAIDQGAKSRLVKAWRDELEAREAQTPSVPAPGVIHPTITAHDPKRFECICCSENASYNLEVVNICTDCKRRIGEARAAQAAQEESPSPPSN